MARLFFAPSEGIEETGNQGIVFDLFRRAANVAFST
jgi:hypothetical protein